MARDSVYANIVEVDMPVVERMAFAMSQKTREEWGAQPPEAHRVFESVIIPMLMQAACPTPAVIKDARATLVRRSPELAALSDDQLAAVWEALIGGISAEAQNISTGFTPDGAPGRL